MKNQCDHCKGEGCKECSYTGYNLPKVNGWNFWRVIEFVAAVIVLIVVGIIILPSFLYAVIKDSGWVKQLNQEPPKRSGKENDSYSHSQFPVNL